MRLVETRYFSRFLDISRQWSRHVWGDLVLQIPILKFLKACHFSMRPSFSNVNLEIYLNWSFLVISRCGPVFFKFESWNSSKLVICSLFSTLQRDLFFQIPVLQFRHFTTWPMFYSSVGTFLLTIVVTIDFPNCVPKCFILLCRDLFWRFSPICQLDIHRQSSRHVGGPVFSNSIFFKLKSYNFSKLVISQHFLTWRVVQGINSFFQVNLAWAYAENVIV